MEESGTQNLFSASGGCGGKETEKVVRTQEQDQERQEGQARPERHIEKLKTNELTDNGCSLGGTSFFYREKRFQRKQFIIVIISNSSHRFGIGRNGPGTKQQCVKNGKP